MGRLHLALTIEKHGGAIAFAGLAVQVTPLTADLDVGLVDPDRTTMRAPKLAQPLLDHRSIGKYPAVNRAVVHFEAALLEHLLKVSVAERIPQIPGRRLHDEPCSKCRPLKSSFDQRFSFSAMVLRITGSLHKFEARISPASVNRRLTKKFSTGPVIALAPRTLERDERLGFSQ
ncbi:hypothetical protein HFN63_33290 [Rhizobium leguminosarum]|nr:hypothetical protein [Rhizobium leguminosarum]